MLKWSGIPADLSVSSLEEGARQFKKLTKRKPNVIYVNPNEGWVKQFVEIYDSSLFKSSLIIIFTKVLAPNCFILEDSGSGITYRSSEPI